MSIQPILIVGAGPTGLSAAAFLSKLGLKVRIIDKNAARSTQSKALGIQAGTLECFDHAFGPEMSQTLIAAGRPANEGWIYLNDEKPFHLKIGGIPSRYPYILITAQSETERILEEHLNRQGVFVERNIELVSLQNRSKQVLTQMKKTDGEITTFEASYVFGCDGAHSQVRHSLGISFRGGSYIGNFVLADAILDWSWASTGVQVFANHPGILAAFPLKGEKRYRLVMLPREDLSSNTSVGSSAEISQKDLEEIVSRLSKGKIKILSTEWSTRFRVHHRLARQFQKGRSFLLGDAAHIHSPTGGQGMNIGIQDAFNLASKVKQVVSGDAPETLLESYEKERMPVARNVVRTTDLAFRLILKSNQSWVSFLGKNLFFPIATQPWIQKRLVTAVSEVKVARKEIERSVY